MADKSQQWQAGGVISVDPMVTYTLPGADSVLGIAESFPDLFRNRRALHFVGVSSAKEITGFGSMIAKVAEFAAELPDNRFVLVVNDNYQAFLASQHGLATIVGNNDILVDERRFVPVDAAGERFDAVYNAHFAPLKRHELATKVDRLMLIYDSKPDPLGEAGDRVRRLLPNAFYANRNANGGYRRFPQGDVVELLARCQVGLCLSAAEGAMRAMMEYLLCGLMVVSTESIGGRNRYLMPPYAMIVSDDPDAVAAAVKAMVAKPIPKEAIRDHIGRIISFERHNFLASINRIAKSHFGVDRLFAAIEPIMEHATRWRRVSEIIAPLREAQ